GCCHGVRIASGSRAGGRCRRRRAGGARGRVVWGRRRRGEEGGAGGVPDVAAVVGAAGPAALGRGEEQAVVEEFGEASVDEGGEVDATGGDGQVHGDPPASAFGEGE